MCTSLLGNVCERPPAQEGQPSTIFNNSKNLASSSQDVRPDISETARRENEKGIVGYAAFSHGGMTDYPRVPLTEWNIGKFPDSMEFQSWKLDFRTEVFMRTAEPQVTMLWIARRTGSPRGSTTGGGEPARVPNLRVCKNFCMVGGTCRRGRAR